MTLMSTTNRVAIAVSLLIVPVLLFAASVGGGAWIKEVPEQNRVRQTPFADDPNAIASGGKLFQRNCTSCHGREATGRNHHPNLHSDRIKTATPGELEWLLRNGSLKRGMPSWSRLRKISGGRWLRF
jgi:mono/diheme cytochrome c family protein